jgi:hypothetical protein
MNEDKKDSIGHTVARMLANARIGAALSDPWAPITPEDAERLARSYERLWSAYEGALDRIQYLELQLAHWADLKWQN